MRIRHRRFESLENRICLDAAGLGPIATAESLDWASNADSDGPPSFAGDANCDGLFDSEDSVWDKKGSGAKLAT